jgi:cell division protein FtsZ
MPLVSIFIDVCCNIFLTASIHLLQIVTSLADPSANIIFGAVVDDRYTGEIHVTIIATGFPQSFQKSLLADPKGARILETKEKAASLTHKAAGATVQPVPTWSRRLFT